MKTRFPYLLLAAAALSLVASAGETRLHTANNSTVCEKTAARMFQSCMAC